MLRTLTPLVTVSLISITILCCPFAVASTTVDVPKWCAHADRHGNRTFEGVCQVNWGVGGVAGCSQPGNLAERYLVRFPHKQEYWVNIMCDDSVTINGKRAKLTRGMRDGREFYTITLPSREAIEFERVIE